MSNEQSSAGTYLTATPVGYVTSDEIQEHQRAQLYPGAVISPGELLYTAPPTAKAIEEAAYRKAAEALEAQQQRIAELKAEIERLRVAANEAADVLRVEAEALRLCSTLNNVWDGTEPDAEKEYARLMALADRLAQPLAAQQDARGEDAHG